MEAARKEEAPIFKFSKRSPGISIKTRTLEKRTMETILRAEKAFIRSLPKTLRTKYTSELAPKIHRKFEPPEYQDPKPAGLWIGRRAYQLGWTKDRFPAEPYTGDRNRPLTERIGKKYQWIALEEIMARLADNYWIKKADGKGTRIYKSRQDIWHLDRIDPTILPPRFGSPSTTASFLGPPPLLIEDIEETDLANWPFCSDHFDVPESWLTGELDGRQWLIADWSESVNEKHADSHPTDPFRRQVQAFVSLVAHKEGDRQKVIDGFLRDHSRGIDTWTLEYESDAFLAHKYGLLSPEEIPFWKSADYRDIFYIVSPIVTGFLPTSNTTDRSLKESIRYIVPHPHIRRALGLYIPDIRRTGLWQLPDRQVFLRKLEDRGSPLLLDREHFDAWCRSEGLDYTWVYIGERTYWSGSAARWRRTLGVAWFEYGKVHFKNDQRDNAN